MRLYPRIPFALAMGVCQSDVANEMEKIGLGSSSDSSYEGPTWSWFVNKVELWQKNNVWDSFSAEFLWDLYCKIKKA